ncbi:(2Fe-2S)-binding protein [Streptomyces sp. NPDC090029]|uniref:(2Fe-2S)-binding protein n=1 Tax=Streptomyces sp. NPDC090029 TaxID=3365924 RepID=UPI003806EE8E
MILAPAPAPRRPAESCSALMAAAYRRLAVLCPALEVAVCAPGAPAGPGWVDGTELVGRPGLLDALLADGADRITAEHGRTPRPDVTASRFLHGHLWSLCLLLSGPWYLERRVPRLRPEDVRLALRGQGHQVVPGAFACLPGDPAAGLPGVRVLSGEREAAEALLHAVAALARPLCGALSPRLRRGPRALWGMVEDDLVSGIWYLGRMLGEEERAVGEAERLLPGPVAPFPAGAAFRWLTDADGKHHPTRDRAGCCLYYTLRPAEACATCPRTGDAERLRRIAAEPGPAQALPSAPDRGGDS